MNGEQTTVRAIVRELENDVALVEIEQGGWAAAMRRAAVAARV